MDKRDSQRPSSFVVEKGKGDEFLERFNQSKEKHAEFWKEIREVKHRDKQKEEKE